MKVIESQELRSVTLSGLLRNVAEDVRPDDSPPGRGSTPAAPRSVVRPEDCLIIRMRKVRESIVNSRALFAEN